MMVSISVGTLLSALLAGCGASSAPPSTQSQATGNTDPGSNKPVTVTFWYGIGGQLSQQIQQMVQQFNRTHPGIHVVATYQGSYSGGGAEQQKLLAALKAGDPPDIAQIEVHSMPLFASSGKLADITSLMNQSASDRPTNFLQGMLASTQFHGHSYGLPFNRSVPVFYYNKALFASAGISSPPATWGQLTQDAAKLTRGSGDNKVYGFEPLVDWWPWEYEVMSSGGTILSSDGQSATFGQANAVGILEAESKLVQSGDAMVESGPNYWDLMISDFAHGKVAMDIDSIGSAGEIASEINHKFQWGTAILPTYQGHKLEVPPGGGDIAMMSGIPEQQQKAAWTFMQWWTSPAQDATWSMMTGYLPTQTATVNLASYQAFLKKNPQYQVALSELKYQVSPPASPDYLTVVQDVQQGLQAIFDEGKPVSSTMQQVAGQVDHDLQSMGN
ncbi:MAG: ABC transporter substrate-binding protein [Alicyclobacillus sp.]|nr:ABC transporter substrate-binding protein [Alicyclobacillus sp.]